VAGVKNRALVPFTVRRKEIIESVTLYSGISEVLGSSIPKTEVTLI
jgi:hypothetical protein